MDDGLGDGLRRPSATLTTAQCQQIHEKLTRTSFMTVTPELRADVLEALTRFRSLTQQCTVQPEVPQAWQKCLEDARDLESIAPCKYPLPPPASEFGVLTAP